MGMAHGISYVQAAQITHMLSTTVGTPRAAFLCDLHVLRIVRSCSLGGACDAEVESRKNDCGKGINLDHLRWLWTVREVIGVNDGGGSSRELESSPN